MGEIETVQLIVQASVCLQKFLQCTSSNFYSLSGFADMELSDGSIKEGDWSRTAEKDDGRLKKYSKV